MFFKPKTPEKTEKRRRFWKKARRRLGWTLAVLFVAHSGLNIYASVLLNRELAAIRQKGEPLQFAELAPPAVPDAQNAALVYQQAFNSQRLSGEEKIALVAPQSERTPHMDRVMEAALRKNQKTLDLVRRAAAMPQCLFPLDWKSTNPFTLAFPHYRRLRELAWLVAGQANWEAKNGDTAAALRDVRVILGMSRHLSNEPYLIGFLVAQALDSIAHRTLAHVLEKVPLTVTEARAFQTSLPHNDWDLSFRHSLRGEQTSTIYIFESLRQLTITRDEINLLSVDTPSSLWTSYPMVLLWRPFLKLDEVQSLRLWRQLLDAASTRQISQSLNPNNAAEKAIKNTPRYAVLTRLLMPVFSTSAHNLDAAEVRRRQREVALALAVFRTARGRYPAQLGEVVSLWKKPLPLDPYSNKPFVYRSDGKSFRLYSVGANRRNDGGRNTSYGSVASKGWKPDDDDILWGGPRR